MAKAVHYRNLWKPASDASRCDNSVPVPVALPATGAPAAAPAPAAPIMITAPAIMAPGMHELARRAVTSWIVQRQQRSQYTVGDFAGVNPVYVRDMTR